jgi:hypothetical protein
MDGNLPRWLCAFEPRRKFFSSSQLRSLWIARSIIAPCHDRTICGNSQKVGELVQAPLRLHELDASIFMALQTPGISARLGGPVSSVKTAKLLTSAHATADRVAWNCRFSGSGRSRSCNSSVHCLLHSHRRRRYQVPFSGQAGPARRGSGGPGRSPRARNVTENMRETGMDPRNSRLTDLRRAVRFRHSGTCTRQARRAQADRPRPQR